MISGMTTGPRGPLLITVASVAILSTVLAFQQWGGLHPCVLCMYQRIPYQVVIVGGAVATVLTMIGWRGVAALIIVSCGLAFLAGAGAGAYHVGIEQHWWEGISACTGITAGAVTNVEEMRRLLEAAPVVRCDDIPWSMFGISMAGYNVLASMALAVFAGLTARALSEQAA